MRSTGAAGLRRSESLADLIDWQEEAQATGRSSQRVEGGTRCCLLGRDRTELSVVTVEPANVGHSSHRLLFHQVGWQRHRTSSGRGFVNRPGTVAVPVFARPATDLIGVSRSVVSLDNSHTPCFHAAGSGREGVPWSDAQPWWQSFMHASGLLIPAQVVYLSASPFRRTRDASEQDWGGQEGRIPHSSVSAIAFWKSQ